MYFTQFEKQLLKKGLKKGVHPDVLYHFFKTRLILSSPLDWWTRRNKAKHVQRNSKYTNFIDQLTGYRFLGPSDLPGTIEAVEAAKMIYNSRQLDHKKSKKPFFSNIMLPEDIDNHPVLMAFAESPVLVEAVACYLNTWPQLTTIGIFVSPPNDTMLKSQMYHVDGSDTRLVKCFINVQDVGPDNGPFTFIPADKSDKIRSKINHRWRGPRLCDEEVMAHCSPDDVISLTGPSKTGALVDTARCLHFGSRCEVGHRVVIMICYARKPNFMSRDHGDARGGKSIFFGGY